MKERIVIFFVTGLFILLFGISASAQDLVWENIGKQILDVNTVLVDRLNPRYIYLGTARGIFRSQDGGESWRSSFGVNKKTNFLLQDRTSIIYAATSGGLFVSQDQGRNWKRIFRGRRLEENECRTVAVLKTGQILLGTDAGLFISKDNARTWHKQSGRLGNIAVFSIAEDLLKDVIYIASRNAVFKLKEGLQSYTEIFTKGSIEIDNDDNEDKEGMEDSSDIMKIRHIALDPNRSGSLYLATESGVFISEDEGTTWSLMSNFGLLDKDVKFILLSKNSEVYAISKSGIFVYGKQRWQELSLRLPTEDIRFLAMDNQDNLYAATDKGLFKAIRQDYTQEKYGHFEDEPAIKQLHEAAIKYAQVIDPERIENLRIQSRLKAILPEINLDYDKTISSYSNSSATRFEVGPSDWGISLKWDLGDLIWSEQQRLIDSQVRLMVVLRNDILDELNRLYFERRKVKLELAGLSPNDSKKISEKRMRLEELTASLDALTGGYFSQHLKN